MGYVTSTEDTRAMHDDILVYGANGYTAGLIIERAVAAGATPVLPGVPRRSSGRWPSASGCRCVSSRSTTRKRWRETSPASRSF